MLNAMSVSQAFFFFLRLICVSDKNVLPFSGVSLLSKDPTPESVGRVGRVVGQFGGTVGRCELAVGVLEVKEAVERPHTKPPTGLTTCLRPGGYWRPA